MDSVKIIIPSIKFQEVNYNKPSTPLEDKFNIPGQFSSPINRFSNQALRANEISANLDESNIIIGSRSRKPKFNSSAAVFVEPNEDYDVNSGLPFFSCLANAITTDKLAGKVDQINEDETCKIHDSKYNNNSSINDPNSWKQMLNHPNRNKFMMAAEEEFRDFKTEAHGNS